MWQSNPDALANPLYNLLPQAGLPPQGDVCVEHALAATRIEHKTSMHLSWRMPGWARVVSPVL